MHDQAPLSHPRQLHPRPDTALLKKYHSDGYSVTLQNPYVLPTLFNGKQHCVACGKRLKFELVSHQNNGKLHCLACDKRKLESVFKATAPLYQPYLRSDCSHSLPQALENSMCQSRRNKIRFAAPLYQLYLRSDSLHSPPQVLGNYCPHCVKIQNDPLPSAGSENVAITGGAQPKLRDTTSLRRRVWGSDVRLSCARATE